MRYRVVCVVNVWDEFEADSDVLAAEELHRRAQAGWYGQHIDVLQPGIWDMVNLLRVDQPGILEKTTSIPKDENIPNPCRCSPFIEDGPPADY